MEYLIGHGLSVTTSANNELGQTDIDKALLALTGFIPIPTEGVTVWERDQERVWLPRDGSIEMIDRDTHLNARPASPSLESGFAQRLLRIVPMAVNPVVFTNGSLVGGWHVENIPQPAKGDIMTGGYQLHVFQHALLPTAIAMVYLQTMGIGQEAWIYMGEFEGAEPELHYIMPLDSTVKVLNGASAFTRAPELDKYAAVGVPPEVLENTLTTAKLKRAAKVPA